ncbi:MAG: DUF1330 domain-containing protein [Acidimicrobiales bacterium]
MTKAYVICDIEVTDSEAYDRYRELSGPAAARYGGRYLVRGGEAAVLEGDRAAHRVVVVEFEDMATARRWYDSPEYTEARRVREGAARASFILAEGC